MEVPTKSNIGGKRAAGGASYSVLKVISLKSLDLACALCFEPVVISEGRWDDW